MYSHIDDTLAKRVVDGSRCCKPFGEEQCADCPYVGQSGCYKAFLNDLKSVVDPQNRVLHLEEIKEIVDSDDQAYWVEYIENLDRQDISTCDPVRSNIFFQSVDDVIVDNTTVRLAMVGYSTKNNMYCALFYNTSNGHMEPNMIYLRPEDYRSKWCVWLKKPKDEERKKNSGNFAMLSFKQIPIYKHDIMYARKNNEVDVLRGSSKINRACASAIEKLISENFDGMHLNEKCVSETIQQFGAERVLFILSGTVVRKCYDGRFSASNRKWATKYQKAFYAEVENPPEIPFTWNVETHPAILDGFITLARKSAGQ